MIAIGSCDICGEFCASDIDDDFATAEYHNRLAERLHDCDERHVGPWHGTRGEPLKKCAWCAELAAYRGADNTLDHSDCRRCTAERPMRGRRAPAGWRRRTPLQLEPRFYVPSPRAIWMPGPQGAITRQLRRDVACTEPADRRRAERALGVYFGRPARVRWYDSPRELGAAFSEAAHKAGLHLPAEEDEAEELDAPFSFWNMAPAPLRERVTWGSHERLGGTADAVVRDFEHEVTLLASTLSDLATPEDDEIRLPTTDAGQFDLDGRRADVTEAARGQAITDGGFLQLLAELRASTGPALIFDGAVHILERPLALRLDERFRLHSEDGPALAYADGTEAWAIHGVVVPRQVVAAPERLTVDQIDAQPNQEIRRVMIERFGVERLMREANAELVSTDATGKLWRWQPGQGHWWGRRSEPVVVVEVVNATPEPDGSFRTYFLRVPPQTTSARAAVAWTFGLEAGGYDPVAQT